ncbi:MAG: helix-turn-helix transcriptional regulator [Ruminococcaceae bacterium]|nr:helix-turn-helix transcriptional regulator [Oscillospiraceae bacterium]
MNQIKKLRKARGLLQSQLAAELGVHQTAVSQWETGRTDPDVSSAHRLADFFGVTLDEVLGHSKKEEQLEEVYLNLARAARDRELRLSQQDIEFILDFAEKLQARDRQK